MRPFAEKRDYCQGGGGQILMELDEGVGFEGQADCLAEADCEKAERKRPRAEALGSCAHGDGSQEFDTKTGAVSDVSVCLPGIGMETGGCRSEVMDVGTKRVRRISSDASESCVNGTDNDGVATPLVALQAESDDRLEKKPVGVDGKDLNEEVDLSLLQEEAKQDPRSSELPRRYKKRKLAIFVAYSGVGYQGMQRNPGALTIEGELEEALFRAGAIAESIFGNPKKIDWIRAARTDKGVSAVGQVVSGRFFIDPPGLVERVNSHLPEQIRVMGYKRVVHTFSAKNLCDRRRYEYVLPVFAFDPSVHRYENSAFADGVDVRGAQGDVRASEQCRLSTEAEMLCGEDLTVAKPTGPEVPGAEVVRNVGFGTQDIEQLNEAITCTKVAVGDESISNGNRPASGNCNCEVLELPSPVLQKAGTNMESAGAGKPVDIIAECGETRTFQFDQQVRQRLNKVLRQYVGTHNFHNFTSRTKAQDPRARRYMVSFEAGEPFEINGEQFVSCVVVGQSFMLHQIRKMIGLAVAIMRGCVPASVIDVALKPDVNFHVPTAPEVGLFLDECMYPAYNNRFNGTHEEISLKDFEKDINDFKAKFIYPHIANSEAHDRVVASWLLSLNDHEFPDFVRAREQGENFMKKVS